MKNLAAVIALLLSFRLAAQVDTLAARYSRAVAAGDYSSAVTVITKMIGLQPQNDRLYFLRARLYCMHSIENDDSAYADFSRAILLNDTSASYYFARGALLKSELGEEHFKMATADFLQVIRLDSFYYPAYQNICIYYFWNDAAKAAKYRLLAKRKMEEAVAGDSLRAGYWYWLGEADEDCMHNSRVKISPDEIIKCYSKAIDLGIREADCYFERGVFYYGSKDYDSCIADMRKAISLSDWVVYRQYIVLSYEGMGQDDKAMEEIDAALAESPGDQQMLAMKSDLLKKENRGK